MRIRGFRQAIVSLLWHCEPDDGPGRIWIGDSENAALIDPVSGRVFSCVWRDDATTLGVTLFVPLWQGLHILRQFNGYLGSLRPFPRAAIELGSDWARWKKAR